MEYITYVSDVTQNYSLNYFTNAYINNSLIGRFGIRGAGFNTGQPMSLSIYVDDNYRGLGISKELIKRTCNLVKRTFPDIRYDQMLVIDFDASDGFWTHIGMKNSRYYGSKRNLESRGYQGDITFRDLCNYAHGVIRGSGIHTYKKKPQKRKTKKRKTQKRKTQKRKTKSKV